MKKVSTAVTMPSRNISQQKLTIGLDLGDRNSRYCVVDEAGQMLGAGSAAHSGTVRCGLRSQALGPEAGGAWRKERQEASHRGHGKKTGGVAASSVGERRSVRSVTQQQPKDSSGSRVKIKTAPRGEKTKAKAEFR